MTSCVPTPLPWPISQLLPLSRQGSLPETLASVCQYHLPPCASWTHTSSPSQPARAATSGWAWLLQLPTEPVTMDQAPPDSRVDPAPSGKMQGALPEATPPPQLLPTTKAAMEDLPSESMLLSAVGGMTDTLHRPSGHLVIKDSLHDVCTCNRMPVSGVQRLSHTPGCWAGQTWAPSGLGAAQHPPCLCLSSSWPALLQPGNNITPSTGQPLTIALHHRQRQSCRRSTLPHVFSHTVHLALTGKFPSSHWCGMAICRASGHSC